MTNLTLESDAVVAAILDLILGVATSSSSIRIIVVDTDGTATVERCNFSEIKNSCYNATERKDTFSKSNIDPEKSKNQIHTDSLGSDDSESGLTREQSDEIIIISDKELETKSSSQISIKLPAETVTVLKTPLRIKKNKRMIKSPFKRTNDLLCSKVDKMIRSGSPDIQLLRSLLNYLSDNNIGCLLAKLISNEEFETVKESFIAAPKDEICIFKKHYSQETKENDECRSSVGSNNAADVCSKLPTGITVNVVSKIGSDEIEKKNVLNSESVIDNIIQSGVKAAQCMEKNSSKVGLASTSRSLSIVELDITPPSTPKDVDNVGDSNSGCGGLRIANIKTLLAPKEDIIIPEVPIRISDTVSLSKQSEDDDISIIEENLSPATITRHLPNVSISRSNPSQHISMESKNHSSGQSSQTTISSLRTTSNTSKTQNTLVDGRGKLRINSMNRLGKSGMEQVSLNPVSKESFSIPMNELIRRYLYPSGEDSSEVQIENPWDLPQDLAMYEELLRTNMASTKDTSQYSAYVTAYEELIKSYMSASPENHAKIVAKYNFFSSEKAHNDHDKPSTSRQASSGTQHSETNRSSLHQRTPVIVSAASLKNKAQYKECSIGSDVTLTPVSSEKDEPQPGPSKIKDVCSSRYSNSTLTLSHQVHQGYGIKRSVKESSGGEQHDKRTSLSTRDEFVMEQAETDKMKADRSRTKMMSNEYSFPKRRKRHTSKDERSSRDLCMTGNKRRVKVTAMRHNPLRKGQVTVDSTDSENEHNNLVQKKKETKRHEKQENLYLKTRNFNNADSPMFPRKTNINKAALKINKQDSDSSESWKQTESDNDTTSSDED